MKIPATLPITAEQSRVARFQLGLTQANVIEQSELAGHKLKNFETGRFVPDMAFLQSLRAFYEERGIQFNEAEPAKTEAETEKQKHGVGIVAPIPNGRFVVDPNLTMEEVDSTLERMDNNDARIAELMTQTLESGLLSSYSAKTQEATQELYGLMAENYLLFRALQGRNIMTPPPDKAQPKTQGDLIGGLYATTLLSNQQQIEEPTEEKGAA